MSLTNGYLVTRAEIISLRGGSYGPFNDVSGQTLANDSNIISNAEARQKICLRTSSLPAQGTGPGGRDKVPVYEEFVRTYRYDFQYSSYSCLDTCNNSYLAYYSPSSSLTTGTLLYTNCQCTTALNDGFVWNGTTCYTYNLTTGLGSGTSMTSCPTIYTFSVYSPIKSGGQTACTASSYGSATLYSTCSTFSTSTSCVYYYDSHMAAETVATGEYVDSSTPTTVYTFNSSGNYTGSSSCTLPCDYYENTGGSSGTIDYQDCSGTWHYSQTYASSAGQCAAQIVISSGTFQNMYQCIQ